MNCIELIQVFCTQKNAFDPENIKNEKQAALTFGQFGSK